MRAKQIIFLFVLILLVILLVPFFFPNSFPGLNRMVGNLGVKVGSLTITGTAPQVLQIYLNESPTVFQPLSNSPPAAAAQYSAIELSLKYLTITAMIYDINGDCGSFTPASQSAFVCDAIPGTPIACNVQTANFTLAGTKIVAGSPATYCNITFATLPYNYWRRYGNASINVTVVDSDTLYNNTRQYWYYLVSQGLQYPYPYEPAILLGGVTAGQWNYGRPNDVTYGVGDNITNTGNIRLNVTWNASNFIENPPGIDVINMDGTNFCIDNDTTIGGHACMPFPTTNVVWYQPTGGIRRCNNDQCNADEDGSPNDAYYKYFWHINVPAVSAGQYNNTIQFTGNAYYGAG